LPARPGSAAEFFVADNGAGFDMAQAGRLFRSFQRLHRQNEFEGNGIGLATVQRIVDRHAGSIRVDARPGIGANFYFTLQQTTGTNPGVNDPR
jgi:light-regulated signal transduction histidine kinase (bacteriophytochrome)